MTDVPLNLNLPNYTQTLNRELGQGGSFSPILGGVNPLIARALTNYDVNRVQIGSTPLTRDQFGLAARAANTLNYSTHGPIGTASMQAATPAPTEPWYVNAARDVQNIASSVPKIPGALISEGAELAQHGGPDIQHALNTARNPLEAVGNLAEVPGLRMLPGAYTLSSALARGGPGYGEAIQQHPLNALLDVLPFASKAASLTATSRAAQEAAAQASDIANLIPHTPGPITSLIKYGRPGGPIPTEVHAYGQTGPLVPSLEPNIVGRTLNQIGGALHTTLPGQFVASAGGAPSRELSMLQSRYSADIEQALNPERQYIAPQYRNEASQAAMDTADAAQRLTTDFADITPDRQAELTKMTQLGNPGDLANLTDHELDYLATDRAVKDQFTAAEVAGGDLGVVPFRHGDEVYLPNQANAILRSRNLEDRQLAAMKLRDVLNPRTATTAEPADIYADMNRAASDTTIPLSQKKILTRGYLDALGAQGYDVAEARSAITDANTDQLTELASHFNMAQTPTTLPHTLDDITAALKPYARQSVQVNKFLDRLNRGDEGGAARLVKPVMGLRGVGNKLAESNIDFSSLHDLLTQRRNQLRSISALEDAGYSDKALRFQQQFRIRREQDAVPARFQEVVREQAVPAIQRELEAANSMGHLTDDELTRALGYLSARQFGNLEQYLPDIRQYQREARRSWQELAAQGINPTFVHHATQAQINALRYPHASENVGELSHLKSRLWDSGPYVNNLGLALTHQAGEYLIRKGNQAFVDEVASKLTRPLSEIRDELYPVAQDMYAKNPTVTLDQHLANLVNREWAPFDPNAYINGRTPPIGANPLTSLMMPRDVAKNLERLRAQPSDLGKALNFPMKVFRTSILPLSPRFLIHTTLGGLLATTLRSDNPLTLAKYGKRAWAMARAGGPSSILRDVENMTPEEEAASRLAAPGGHVQQAAEFFRDFDTQNPRNLLGALQHYAGGKTLARLWNSAPSSMARQGFNKTVETSYNVSQLMRNFNQSLGYLEGEHTALTKGMTRAEQIRAGVSKGRAVMEQWDQLTPIERSTMRLIFPFYNYARFLLKYTLTYPGDHPWRTAIMANMANAEAKDMGSGLPTELQKFLFLGPMDTSGNVTGLDLSTVNPFRDVANYFTLAGFLAGNGNVSAVTSQVNPIISTALQWAGVDTTQGMPDLYPEMQYDPETGKLVAVPKVNPLLGLVGNLVPQLRAVEAFSGMNSQYRQLAARDPGAAARFLYGSLAIPNLRQNVNLPDEGISAELNRWRAMSTSFNQDIAQGNLHGFASAYPGLAAFTDRIMALEGNPAFTAQYQDANQGPSGGVTAPGIAELNSATR